jgi:hypothetical protein
MKTKRSRKAKPDKGRPARCAGCGGWVRLSGDVRGQACRKCGGRDWYAKHAT